MKQGRLLIDVRLNTLLLLKSRSRHGYELIKDLSILTDRRISAGQIYPLLRDLQKRGLVSVKSTGARSKKIYSLTNKGRRVVESSVLRMGMLLDMFIKSKVSRCSNCGCEVYSGGSKIKRGSKTLYFCCVSCANACGKGKRVHDPIRTKTAGRYQSCR